MADGHTPPLFSDQVSPARATVWVSELGTLLEDLSSVAGSNTSPAALGPQIDNQLVQVRLGIASSLYFALRAKHAATAAHSLRVAMGASVWAKSLHLAPELRDAIELAALLHDVGMIGVPDHVLLKPGPLDREEAQFIERSRQTTVEILRSASAVPAVLGIVGHIGVWYNGAKGSGTAVGEGIPLGARMLAIVEAFDAMTVDQVFRPAISHERAFKELFEFAGSQFDPELVRSFAELHASDQSQLLADVAGRWLHDLDPQAVNACWHWNGQALPPRAADPQNFFEKRLLDNMHDAVVFIDASGRVTEWNHGAERLTGITSSSICQRQWRADLLQMRNEKGVPVSDEECPVSTALQSGVQSLRRLTICGRASRQVSVDSHTIPVVSDDGVTLGAVMLLHDASSEISLEQRCQTLYEKATKDPLTQVANRAEFDRVLEIFVQHHQQQHVPCSLIICDLDHFKQVNDTFGHQVGDEAIISLARLLKSSCRPGDLVARYGGEEFVMLCADCDNATAARRAEQIRAALSQLSHPKMEGRPVTASFGVTEIQPGDTAESMLRRADRGLLTAKGKGRNTVVQLGSGPDPEDRKPGIFRFRKPAGGDPVLEQTLVTPVPRMMTVEKLRGFVADHQATIVADDGDHIQLRVQGGGPRRRQGDRAAAFLVDLRLDEERPSQESTGGSAPTMPRTQIRVIISPFGTRDRRKPDVNDQARHLLAAIRAYLIATVATEDLGDGLLAKACGLLAPWLYRP